MSIFSKHGLEIWLRGLLAAVIGGGSSAVTSALGVNLIDPHDFNLQGGLSPLLHLMGTVFVINALLSLLFYLKQSPLPPAEAESKP